ncbi:MAG: hypothetical protein GOVbin4580_39 [Prokaryotic dsDNA virus sp.]|nr:MAG: hypothetical protein GOVbin4580_39 [Prokaryotic dsDNA virus sp.]|tara:strand:+ start:17711 stop:17938 length:228 start_codon:yes stop_codon:yes gene_type:complete
MIGFTFHMRQGVYMQLVLFERYRIIDIDIGERKSLASSPRYRWFEIRICGLGIDYNIQDEKRWFNSFYNKLWTRG